MKCDRVVEFFSDYLEGKIDYALASAVRSHLSDCKACSREFEMFRDMWISLGAMPEKEPPASFRHDVVMRAIGMQQERQQRRKNSAFIIGLNFLLGRLAPGKAAGFAVAAIIIGMIVLRFIPHQDNNASKSGFDEVPITQLKTEQPYSFSPLDVDRKDEWVDRKLSRNMIWISVESSETVENTKTFKVKLSLNQNALLTNEYINKLHASVHLLPSSDYTLDEVIKDVPVWDGYVGLGSPVLMPVIIKKNSLESGCVNLLVSWRFRRRDCNMVIILPSDCIRPKSSDILDLSHPGSGINGESISLYTAFQGVSHKYGVPLIVNSSLTDERVLTYSDDVNLNIAMNRIIRPLDLDWMYTDNSLYADTKYRARNLQ